MNESGWIFKAKLPWELPDQRSSLASGAFAASDSGKEMRVDLTEKTTPLFSYHLINFSTD